MREAVSRAEAMRAGLAFYRTTKPCKRGHRAKRLAANGTCVECQEASRTRYRADPARREREAAGHRRWQDRNREHVSAYMQQNRERVRATLRSWNEANPEKRRAHVAARRAVRMAAVPPTFDDFDAFVMLEAHAACKRRAELHGEPFHVDHLVPLSRGGLHCAVNVQVIPARLNLWKCGRLVLTQRGEWIAYA